jgi:acetyltransferase-like isoleucine patch superfamily enzyme
MYFRGILTYLYIKSCGGRCDGIPRIGKGVVWKYPPHAGISLGKNVDIGAYCFFDFPKGVDVKIGDHVKLTYNVTCAALNKLTIGSNSMVAEYTSIRDSSHRMSKHELIGKQSLITGAIIIGDDVWIGRGCLLLGNIIVHDGCVIGANSFCSNKVYDKYSIYYGTPARKVKDRI